MADTSSFLPLSGNEDVPAINVMLCVLRTQSHCDCINTTNPRLSALRRGFVLT
jgi:hypothetical protein